jgi:hypothetical protein
LRCEEKAELDANNRLLAIFGPCKDVEGIGHSQLLEMYRHRYLPNEAMIDFIENGVKKCGVKVKVRRERKRKKEKE